MLIFWQYIKQAQHNTALQPQGNPKESLYQVVDI
jgi:hypothetical protein